jgi:hypothetical protein
MEMRKFYYIILLAMLGCQKELKTENIISDLQVTPSTVDADGSSVVNVSVKLTDKAAADKRNVVFTATSGTWSGGANGKVTVAATFSDGHIVAKAKLTAPSSAGKITITAASESLSLNGDYNLSAAVTASKVAPFAIHLEPSSFGIGSNYTGEDTLRATITGKDGNNASKGVSVIFEALNGANPAGGAFRAIQAVSGATSTVSAIYGAPALPIGTAIKIKVTILGDNAVKPRSAIKRH